MSEKAKVLTVFGTRPEAIKLAPVVLELQRHTDRIESRVCVSGQHRDMLDQVLSLFKIVPEYDLNVMTENQTPTSVASAVLRQLEPILTAERPDWVFVQGDTTTMLAAALAAYYAGSRVAQVEAGLRTWDKRQPFPEEVNRRVSGVVADLHFAPTEWAKENLLREGVPPATVCVTGNPVIDALHWAAKQPYTLNGGLGDILDGRRLVVVTAHRRENFGTPLEEICSALRELASAYRGDVHMVYPVHPNPKVRDTVYRRLEGLEGITLLPPLEYLPLVHLLKRAYMVLTDSGGLQEEAPALGKPVLILREITERPEGIEAGTARLVGTKRSDIVRAARQLLDSESEYRKMAQARNPYGDGHAAERIVGAFLSYATLAQS
jgi:UDP-N-acetylglucosamine 2-epimerase (non-hydrolysing)